MTDLVIQLLVTIVSLLCLYALGYMRGKREGYRQRIEELRENVQQVANQAQADLNVLNAQSPPRQRQVRIKGTSRRGTE